MLPELPVGFARNQAKQIIMEAKYLKTRLENPNLSLVDEAIKDLGQESARKLNDDSSNESPRRSFVNLDN